MAFDFNNLPKDLGLIVLDGIDYRILTITEYPTGKQIIELLNMANDEKEDIEFSG